MGIGIELTFWQEIFVGILGYVMLVSLPVMMYYLFCTNPKVDGSKERSKKPKVRFRKENRILKIQEELDQRNRIHILLFDMQNLVHQSYLNIEKHADKVIPLEYKHLAALRIREDELNVKSIKTQDEIGNLSYQIPTIKSDFLNLDKYYHEFRDSIYNGFIRQNPLGDYSYDLYLLLLGDFASEVYSHILEMDDKVIDEISKLEYELKRLIK